MVKKKWREKGKREIKRMKMWWLLCNRRAATHTHTGFIWHHANCTKSRSIRKNFIRGAVTALRGPKKPHVFYWSPLQIKALPGGKPDARGLKNTIKRAKSEDKIANSKQVTQHFRMEDLQSTTTILECWKSKHCFSPFRPSAFSSWWSLNLCF